MSFDRAIAVFSFVVCVIVVVKLRRDNLLSLSTALSLSSFGALLLGMLYLVHRALISASFFDVLMVREGLSFQAPAFVGVGCALVVSGLSILVLEGFSHSYKLWKKKRVVERGE
jgi:hypothetical protein